MRRVPVVAVVPLLLAAFASHAGAQDARQRQAAAQAYDRGTTAYVDQAYEEAAGWFETANRLAPAAPALMQAIRAHERNNNFARVSTLSLVLQNTYRGDSGAATFAQSMLTKYAPQLLRVEVTCDADCKLDLDGKLEEHLTFFVSPQQTHDLVATFETGSQSMDVSGGAGETKEISFASPPKLDSQVAAAADSVDLTKPEKKSSGLSPLVTWIGIGVTAAFGVATIVSGVDATSKVPEYERATDTLKNCRTMTMGECLDEQSKAVSLLEAGQSRETRTNILIGITAAAAVGTSVLAFVFTDWSGGRDRAHNAAARERLLTGLRVAPQPGGAAAVLEGRF